MEITINNLRHLINEILVQYPLSEPHRHAIVENLLTAEIAQCRAHGVWRLLELVKNLKMGMFNPNAHPEVKVDQGSIIRIDCQMGAAQYGHHIGIPLLIERAKAEGIALLALNHAIHFSALWVEIEQLTAANLVGLNMTTSHSWVAPYGGKIPLLGTNPIAFGWPRPDGNPYLFDFSTSATARGEIQLHERTEQPLPKGWAIDAEGEPTTDPTAALAGAMLTFGGYKGSALSTMIELLAGPLIGDLTSQASLVATKGAPLPYGGELLIAIDPQKILKGDQARFFEDAEALLNQFTQAGIRLPSERRFAAREANLKRNQITLEESLYRELKALLHA